MEGGGECLFGRKAGDRERRRKEGLEDAHITRLTKPAFGEGKGAKVKETVFFAELYLNSSRAASRADPKWKASKSF